MKVWILIGGNDYEGESADDMEVFNREPTQEEQDVFSKGYGYILVIEKEVNETT